MTEEPKRPSDPPPTARQCSECKRMKDDSGETYGWGLCHCGSFRLPAQPAAPNIATDAERTAQVSDR